MLVLTRRIDQSIRIGDAIIFTILGVRGGAVRIGIKAPPDVSIHRHEVYELILQAKPSADSVGSPDA